MDIKIQKRTNWVDITKGIAIFLMVCGHTSIPECITKYIWSFHMPLFFIISGFLYNHHKYTFKEFFLKRMHSLLVPYFILTFIAFTGLFIINCADFTELYTGWKGYALWFIPVLFVTEIISSRLIAIDTRFRINSIVFFVILSLLGYILYIKNIHFYFKLETVFLGSFFYSIGYFTKFFINKIELRVKYLAVMFISSFAIAQLIPKLDMAFNYYGLYLPNVFAAILGTYSIIILSKRIEKFNYANFISSFLLWAGRNTLIIIGLSQLLNSYIKIFFNIFPMPNFINSLIRHIVLWLFLYVFSLIVNKYTPFVLGKKH